MNLLRQLIHARPRLLGAILVGLAASTLLPPGWSAVTRLLLGWNITVWLYLALALWLMARSTQPQVRRYAEQEDRSAAAILTLLSVASLASLAAIVLELSTTRQLPLESRLAHYALTGATVFGSWCLVATLYTFHYARAFYRSPSERRALRFPEGEANPDYWDFLYLSFTIAVAAQTSDVAILSRALRRSVLAQSILSFLFNAAIIGFSINIAAGLIGS